MVHSDSDGCVVHAFPQNPPPVRFSLHLSNLPSEIFSSILFPLNAVIWKPRMCSSPRKERPAKWVSSAISYSTCHFRSSIIFSFSLRRLWHFKGHGPHTGSSSDLCWDSLLSRARNVSGYSVFFQSWHLGMLFSLHSKETNSYSPSLNLEICQIICWGVINDISHHWLNCILIVVIVMFWLSASFVHILLPWELSHLR